QHAPDAAQDELPLPPGLLVASPPGDHRAPERHLVLARLHPADGAHHESPRSPRRGGRIASVRWRMKDTRIHAVVYLGNPFRGYTDTLAQVILQIPRDGGVVADHRAMQTAQQAIARVRPVDIENVPSVLAVYLPPDTSERCRQQAVEGREVAAVDYVRIELAEEPVESAVDPEALARLLVHCEDLNVVAPYPPRKIRVIHHAYDRVP